jgi:hypothetical protein
VVIPAELSYNGKSRKKKVGIDACIADIVDALNSGGVLTAQSCCGHGSYDGEILLHDGRKLTISRNQD